MSFVHYFVDIFYSFRNEISESSLESLMSLSSDCKFKGYFFRPVFRDFSFLSF